MTHELFLQACEGTKLRPVFKKSTVRGDDLSQSMKRTLGFCNPILREENKGVEGLTIEEKQKCDIRMVRDVWMAWELLPGESKNRVFDSVRNGTV